MSACETGCVVRGYHLADCDGTRPDRDGVGVVECRGCLPRPADVGVLCSWCWGRLQSVVRTMPALVEHLFEMGRPSTSCALGGAGCSVPAGPRGLYPDAVVAADDLTAALASWCAQVAEALDSPVPVPPGLWVTDAVERVDPATGEAWVSAPEVVGVRDPLAVRALAAWLAPRLDAVAGHPWVGDMLADLADLTRRAETRWPVEERERRVTDVRCPSCGAVSLVMSPPSVAGAEVLVRCTLPGCGRVLAEDDWARARGWALEVARGAAPGAVA